MLYYQLDSDNNKLSIMTFNIVMNEWNKPYK